MASDEDHAIADAITEGRAMPSNRKLAMVIQLHKVESELRALMDLAAHEVRDMEEKKVKDEGVLSHFKLLSQVGFMRAMLEEVHHSMGHALFGACWAATDYGREFEPPPDYASLMSMLNELMGDGKKEMH